MDLSKLDLSKKVLMVITFWNKWGLTQNCIDSIRKHTDMSDAALIIVNDFSDEEEAINWVKNSKENIISTSRNYHHNSIIRQIMDVTKEHKNIEYVCALNNDIFVTDNWLRNILLCMDKDKNIALMGVKDNMDYHWYQNFPIPNEVIPNFGTGEDSRFQEYINREFYAKRKSDAFVSTQTIDGVVMLFRNSLIKEIGGFSPEFDEYGADSEFFIRAIKKGYKVAYCLSSFVYHISGGGGGKYEAFLKNYGKQLYQSASEAINLINEKYGINISTEGRSVDHDREKYLKIERELIQ